MVEKILRTEPNVDKIFVLIKAKSQEAAMDIMKIEVAFLNSVFFSSFWWCSKQDLLFLLCRS